MVREGDRLAAPVLRGRRRASTAAPDDHRTSRPCSYVDRPASLLLIALITIILLLGVTPAARAGGIDPPVVLDKIDAAMAFTCGRRNITVFGQDLQAGAIVKLTRAGEPDIVALQVDRGNLQDG